MLKLYAAIAAVALVGLSGVLWYASRSSGGDQYAQCRESVIAGGAGDVGGPFTLVSETGETVTSEQVIDEPTLIYFGYTYCPDICPMDVARNVEAVQILEERGQSVKPVFITVDPERDTPEQLREFTDYMHPRLVGLTGSEEQVKAASDAYRTYYRKQVDEDDPEFYLMDHSTFSYLTMPQDGFVEFFRRDLPADQLADRVGCFIEARG